MRVDKRRGGLGLLLLLAAIALATFPQGSLRLEAAPAGAGPASSDALVIIQPSAPETTLGEKRDFYVKGRFGPRVRRPGDIRIDLYRCLGDGTPALRVRSLQSRVGADGTTPRSALRWGWPGGSLSPSDCALLPPDLVAGPEGPGPEHKVVVTSDTWAGLVLGGATWLPDIDGPDRRGPGLPDLVAGTYRLVVTGLGGDVRGARATLDLHFGRSRNLFGRFSPAPHMERLQAYGRERGLRLYLDDLPGYFTGAGGRFQAIAREYPNNSLEAANLLPGITGSRPYAHENHVVIWNVHEGAVTQKVEIGAIARAGLVESPRTEWLHYDIGEYAIDCAERVGGEKRHWEGRIVPFGPGRRLEVTRVEVRPPGASSGEATYVTSDATPRRIERDLSAPLVVTPGERVFLCGVTRPLATDETAGPEPATWKLHNRVMRVRYRLTDANLRVIGEMVKDVRLARTTVDGKTVDAIYEFRHELDPGGHVGTVNVTFVGLDARGVEVPGTSGAFRITRRGAPPKGPRP